MPLKLKETTISNEQNRLKNPNWREAVNLAYDRGGEQGNKGSKTVEVRGWGRGKKETLARKPLDFEISRLSSFTD